MSTKHTIKDLANWIRALINAAAEDKTFDVAWFNGTNTAPFSIVGGWIESGFAAEDIDIFCISKSRPKYAMAIKIVVNDGPYAYCDFETLNMPMDINSPDEVDDTLFILEWSTNPEALAQFFYGEWERITEDYREV